MNTPKKPVDYGTTAPEHLKSMAEAWNEAMEQAIYDALIFGEAMVPGIPLYGQAVCECGADKHGWPHSPWCPRWESPK